MDLLDSDDSDTIFEQNRIKAEKAQWLADH